MWLARFSIVIASVSEAIQLWRSEIESWIASSLRSSQ
jgi:hypothetical protein